ncbi:MAG: hypothetical protein LUO89_15725, partial [Methanothrix sp.]|nr:hypothetical protein [Methanothrix sp.]
MRSQAQAVASRTGAAPRRLLLAAPTPSGFVPVWVCREAVSDCVWQETTAHSKHRERRGYPRRSQATPEIAGTLPRDNPFDIRDQG